MTKGGQTRQTTFFRNYLTDLAYCLVNQMHG